MIPVIVLAAILCLVMALPYFPGRFDASAATFSFVVQVASYVSLLLVPVGVAWMAGPRRSRLWYRLALVVAGFIAFAITIAAVSVNGLAIGVMLGIGAIILLRTAYHRLRADVEHAGRRWNSVPFYLVCVPVILVTFRATVLPRAADWSRDRAIEHSAPLISEIEAFRLRRGHYPVSLQSLNRDVPTGVAGIERFHYEPNGNAYNLFTLCREQWKRSITDSGKVYRIVPDARAAKDDLVRIIDESGEDYLFDKEQFVFVDFPATVRKKLLAIQNAG